MKILNKANNINIKKIVILLVVLFIVLPFLGRLNPFYTVEYGTIGVVTRFGKIERSAYPGLNLKVPLFEKVQFYTTQKIIYETSENPGSSPFN